MNCYFLLFLSLEKSPNYQKLIPQRGTEKGAIQRQLFFGISISVDITSGFEIFLPTIMFKIRFAAGKNFF